MTQKEKELLLRDLSARLPYGVKVHINSPMEEQNSMELFDVNLDSEHIGVGNEKWSFRAIPIIDDEDEAKVIKPYLRPMSNMTEEERKYIEDKCAFTQMGPIGGNFCLVMPVIATEWLTDFYNSHHLDWRGLIEKGLAIEAPEGMYNQGIFLGVNQDSIRNSEIEHEWDPGPCWDDGNF